ncbi:MAG: sulfatase-like hydrolase/transferase [Rickettsiales bacterium]
MINLASKWRVCFTMLAVASTMLTAQNAVAETKNTLDRTVLPIKEPTYPPITEMDVRNAKAPPRFEVKAPQGAPNVLVILLDDIGFGQSDAFGGPIHMPVLDKLASEGLRYNRFHTTALCSPSRMALLTGRNHHANNTGAVMEVATAFPGNTSTPATTITKLTNGGSM